ncbi:MAG: putative membrane protein [Myxococcota bacterium]
MIALLLLACTGGEGSDSAIEVVGECDDIPVVTWDNFGDGFVTESCQTCHASTSEDRNGAPETVTFDTREEALAQADNILRVVASDTPTMPPQGGISDDDRTLVSYWLTCWESQ